MWCGEFHADRVLEENAEKRFQNGEYSLDGFRRSMDKCLRYRKHVCVWSNWSLVEWEEMDISSGSILLRSLSISLLFLGRSGLWVHIYNPKQELFHQFLCWLGKILGQIFCALTFVVILNLSFVFAQNQQRNSLIGNFAREKFSSRMRDCVLRNHEVQSSMVSTAVNYSSAASTFLNAQFSPQIIKAFITRAFKIH